MTIIKRVPVGDVDVDHGLWYVRRHLHPAALVPLINCLRDDGQREPILVRPSCTGDQLHLVAGRRRLEAARMLGCTTILAELLEGTDAEMASRGLSEEFGAQAGMTLLERGWAVWMAQRVRRKEGLPASVRGMSASLHLQKSTVHNAARIGRAFPPDVVGKVASSVGVQPDRVIDLPQAPLLEIIRHVPEDDPSRREHVLGIAMRAHVDNESARGAVRSALETDQDRTSANRPVQSNGVPLPRTDRPITAFSREEAADLLEDLEGFVDVVRRRAGARPTAVQPVQSLDAVRLLRRLLAAARRLWQSIVSRLKP